jgi:O-antigen/teichoic acid export membrane protein
MLNLNATHFAHVSVLARGVISQAILSAASFAVGVMLLRYGSDAQYGYYVLVFNGVTLMTSLQGAFVGTSVLWFCHLLGRDVALLCLVGIGAAWAALYRQFFRMVSNACQDSAAALSGDLAFVVTLICGTAIGILTVAPAIVTLISLCVAAIAGGFLNARLLWRQQRWNVHADSGVWREIAVIGYWTATGSVAHWAFSQGYNYLIVGVLSVGAVAAAGSTRMLMTPMILLSTGVSSLMLSTVSAWLREHGARGTLRRVMLGAAAICGVALLYLALLWWARDFIFDRVLHKHFAQRDLMLVLWLIASLMMLVRDQLVNFLLARTRYRSLTGLSVVCAIVSLSLSYALMLRIGVAGAPAGVLIGEIINVAGLTALSRLELRRDRPGTQSA